MKVKRFVAANLILSILLVGAFLRVLVLCSAVSGLCDSHHRVEKLAPNGVIAIAATNISKFRNFYIQKIRSTFPSPHSELIIGLILGADELKKTPTFNDVLRRTGTIHVAVVSGYNINLFYIFLGRIFGQIYQKRNLVLIQITSFAYAVITGFGMPVVRAWVMSGVVFSAKYSGRSLNVYSVLIFTAALIILILPFSLFDLSFVLSFLATLSLIMFTSPVKKTLDKLFKPLKPISEDFATTISAQVLVWPYISYMFGQVSLLSPLINGIILWTIPLSTSAGLIYVGATSLSLGITKVVTTVLSWFLFVFTDIFIKTVSTFGKITFVSIEYKLSLSFLVIYYIIALLLGIYFEVNKTVK